MPEIVTPSRFNFTCESLFHFNSSRCARLNRFADYFHQLNYQAHLNINQHVESILEIISNFETKGKRSWFPALGYVIGTVTGLAHTDDLADFKHIVTKIQADTIQAIETWTSTSSNVLTAVQLDSKRINNLAIAVNRTQRTTQFILRTLMREHQLSRTVINLTQAALKQSVSYIERLIDIAHLQSAFTQLISGRLSHDLVPSHTLTSALDNLRAYLLANKRLLSLIFSQPQYYYQSAHTVIS